MTRTALLERISKVNPESVLNSEVVPGVKEIDIVKDAIERARTLRTPEGIIEFPGMTLWQDLILRAVADFKKNIANNAPVNFASKVTANDMAVESLDRPEVFSGVSTYRQTGLTTGALVPILSSTSGTNINMLVDKERYIITDFISYDPAGGIEGIQIFPDGDANVAAQSVGNAMRGESSMRIVPLDFPIITDQSLRIEARLNQGTTIELVPVGIRVFVGSEVRAL